MSDRFETTTLRPSALRELVYGVDYWRRHVGSEPSRSALPDPAQAGDLYVRVGERLAKHGDLKDALTALQVALRFDESSLQARLLLAWLNRARSQSKKAVSLYREVLQRDQETPQPV